MDCISLLESNYMISDNGIIYIETEAEINLGQLPLTWRLKQKKQAGRVSYCLYHKIDKKGEPSLPIIIINKFLFHIVCLELLEMKKPKF